MSETNNNVDVENSESCRNDESSHTADEEDIIYITDELITNNIL